MISYPFPFVDPRFDPRPDRTEVRGNTVNGNGSAPDTVRSPFPGADCSMTGQAREIASPATGSGPGSPPRSKGCSHVDEARPRMTPTAPSSRPPDSWRGHRGDRQSHPLRLCGPFPVYAPVGVRAPTDVGRHRHQPRCPVPSPTASAAAAVAVQCAKSPCPFDPKKVDLNGTWSGDDGGIYYLRHVDSVVWWNGMSGRERSPSDLGRGWNNVGRGKINELKIEVEWADVPAVILTGSAP